MEAILEEMEWQDDFHEDDGIGEVDEVPVAVANQLAEFLLLVLDLFSGRAFDIIYFRKWVWCGRRSLQANKQL